MGTQPSELLRLVHKTGRWRSLNFPSGALLGKYPLLDWCLLNSPSSSQSQQPLSWVLMLRASPKATDDFSSMPAKGQRKWVWTEKCHPEGSDGCLDEKLWYPTLQRTCNGVHLPQQWEKAFVWSPFFHFQNVPLSLKAHDDILLHSQTFCKFCFWNPSTMDEKSVIWKAKQVS